MICTNCGTENETGRKFCGECAARLSVACPSCGAANTPGAKFCGECAAPLTLASTLTRIGARALLARLETLPAVSSGSTSVTSVAIR